MFSDMFDAPRRLVFATQQAYALAYDEQLVTTDRR